MAWDVRLLQEVERWVLELDDDSYNQVAAAIDKLAEDGPALGRPLVDRIEASRHHNMKELRPARPGARRSACCSCSTRSDARFCSSRATKAGDWTGWYRRTIPIADDRYDEWLEGERG